MGTGLPWDYRVGPGTDSERTHLKRMVPDLPPRSLVVADAGFVGYVLCRKLILRGHSFLLRVGRNITLLTGLGSYHEERNGLVYLWPHKHRRWRPLVLRLITLRQGKQTVYLLTNVLDEKELTGEEAVTLYAMRWGEEVFFRSYKQTLQRRKLLSRTPKTCLAEAEWTLMGLWLLGLISVSRVLADGGDPLSFSVAKARDAVRRAMRNARPPQGRRPPLAQELARAVKDDYDRLGSKKARNYPRKKREKPPGAPKIQSARPAEIRRAARFAAPEIRFQCTA
jgi:DDE family transposase